MLIINEYIPTDLFKNLEFAMAYYSTNYVLAFCGLLQLGVVNVLTKKTKKNHKIFRIVLQNESTPYTLHKMYKVKHSMEGSGPWGEKKTTQRVFCQDIYFQSSPLQSACIGAKRIPIRSNCVWGEEKRIACSIEIQQLVPIRNQTQEAILRIFFSLVPGMHLLCALQVHPLTKTKSYGTLQLTDYQSRLQSAFHL